MDCQNYIRFSCHFLFVKIDITLFGPVFRVCMLPEYISVWEDSIDNKKGTSGKENSGKSHL